MRLLSVSRRSALQRGAAALGLAAVVAGLAGCYVVPIDPRTGQPAAVPSGAPVVASAPALPVSFPARLYPANDLHGRGTFNANINGESFVGEATRKAGSSREGVANGAGNRGGYLGCQYTMNSSTQGTGSCRLNNGAVFTMHVGN